MFPLFKAVHSILRLSSNSSEISKSTEMLLLLTSTTEEVALFLSSFSFLSWASSLLLTIWFNRSLDFRDIFSSKCGHSITNKIEGIDSDDKILKADLASPFCTLSNPYKFSKGHSAHFISDVCIPDFFTIYWNFLINFRNFLSLNSDFNKNIQISPNAKSRSVLTFFWIFLKCLAIAYNASVLSFNNIFHLIFGNSAFQGKSISEFTRYWLKSKIIMGIVQTPYRRMFFFLPPYKLCTIDFISDILDGRKKVSLWFFISYQSFWIGINQWQGDRQNPTSCKDTPNSRHFNVYSGGLW